MSTMAIFQTSLFLEDRALDTNGSVREYPRRRIVGSKIDAIDEINVPSDSFSQIGSTGGHQ
jgi:hypothetical protein